MLEALEGRGLCVVQECGVLSEVGHLLLFKRHLYLNCVIRCKQLAFICGE